MPETDTIKKVFLKYFYKGSNPRSESKIDDKMFHWCFTNLKNNFLSCSKSINYI